MYSRYSGISIPKNYGGSRFQPEREPEVKAHRPPSLSASRVAHSPSFVPIESRANEDYNENSVVEESFTSEDSISSEEICEECEVAEAEPYDEVKIDDEIDAEVSNEAPVFAKRRELSSLKSIISRFDKDTLLLLGLILLLMSDDKENDDIIALLALVLLG